MALFLRELRRNQKSFLIWTVILVLYNVMVFALYPTLADQSEYYQEMIKNMPQELLAAFNINQLDFGYILSFFGTYSYLYYLLSGSIYAMILGAGILSKEESDKTIEFLLAKPITRNSIVTGKMACTLVYLFLFNLIYSLSSFILAEIYKQSDYSVTALMLLCLGSLLVFYLFASVGLLLSVFIVKAKSIYPIAIGTVMGAFILGITSEIAEGAKGLKYLSPFKYVDSNQIIASEQIDGVYLLLFTLVTLLSILLTYVFYNRKNITL